MKIAKKTKTIFISPFFLTLTQLLQNQVLDETKLLYVIIVLLRSPILLLSRFRRPNIFLFLLPKMNHSNHTSLMFLLIFLPELLQGFLSMSLP